MRPEYSRAQFERRIRDFPEAIIEASRNNAAICNYLYAYGRGNILTREEALCQMVMAMEYVDRQRRERDLEGFARLAASAHRWGPIPAPPPPQGEGTRESEQDPDAADQG